jgi:hypothetical protein
MAAAENRYTIELDFAADQAPDRVNELLLQHLAAYPA